MPGNVGWFKADLLTEEERARRYREIVEGAKVEGLVFTVSAHTDEGCGPLMYKVQDRLEGH